LSESEFKEVEAKMEFLRKNVADALDVQKTPRTRRDLPDIEDLGSKDLPLCQFHSFSRLRTIGAIKHPQRKGIANFLRDVGYTDVQTEKFMVSHFERSRRSMSSHEEDQWKTEVNRYSHGKPATTFGKACQALGNSVEHAKTGDKKDSHGCPYVFYDEIGIKNLLREKGLTNEDLIESISKIARMMPTKACQMEMDDNFQRTQNEYEYASPQGYLFKTLWRKKINFPQN
jgi:hypothetical protein